MVAARVVASGSLVESTAGRGGGIWLAVVVLLVGAAALWPGSAQRLPGLTRSHAPARDRTTTDDVDGDEGAGGPDGGGARVDGAPGSSPQSAWVSPWRRFGAPARRKALDGALAELVAALAAPLRSGVPPAVAIAAAAPAFRDDEALELLLRDLSTAAARGAPVSGVWLRHGADHRSPDLSFIGRAWGLSELTGAPLADALACAEQTLRARSRSRERLAAAAAGPRASMTVLCLLPASGPAVGWVMGVDPVTLYFSSPVATGSLLVGIALGLAAWGWSRRILRSAS